MTTFDTGLRVVHTDTAPPKVQRGAPSPTAPPPVVSGPPTITPTAEKVTPPRATHAMRRAVVDGLGLSGHRVQWRRLAWTICAVALHAPIGLVRAAVWVWRWVNLGEAQQFRDATRADPLAGGDAWLRHRHEQRQTRGERIRALQVITAVTVVTLVITLVMAPRVLAGVTVMFVVWLAWYGWTWRHEPRELLATVAEAQEAPAITYDALIEALSRLGIAPLTKAIKDNPTGALRWVTVPSQTANRKGTFAQVELPPGVCAVEVVSRRPALASALARPLGCVWPTVDAEAHPGRLDLYIAKEDMARAKQEPWPYMKDSAVGDYFGDFQIGTDPMGRPVTTKLDEMNSLFGGQPGYGKSSGMSVVLGWSALDPTVEHWVFDLKGLGDWQDAPLFAARYAAGQDDETAEAVMEALAELRRELGKRAKTMERHVPRDLKPNNKVTRQIANANMGLHPLHVVIDEAQEIFLHPTHGKRAGDLAVACSKLGRALGVHLQIATQRPDADSIPTALRANIAIRSCFRVADRHTNDMILGDGMRGAGLDAGQFSTRDKGIAWVIGATSHDGEPVVTRYHYLNGHDRRRLFERARMVREEAGTLRGLAAGVEPETAPDTEGIDVVGDIYTVTRGREKIHTVNLLELLKGAWPQRYADLEARGLAEMLQAHDVRSIDVWDGPLDGGQKKSAKGYELAPLHDLARRAQAAA